MTSTNETPIDQAASDAGRALSKFSAGKPRKHTAENLRLATERLKLAREALRVKREKAKEGK